MNKNIRILSTKPLHPEILSLAEREGIHIVTIPFIKTQARTDQQLIEKIKTYGQQALTAIFTSRNAVAAVFSCIEAPSEWSVCCISGKTKTNLLPHIDEKKIIATAPNGQALAAKILDKNPAAPVVFFCGNKRMSTIPEALQRHHIDFEELVVYDTMATPVVLKEVFDGILFFSPSAVESFCSVNPVPGSTLLFAVGETTQKAIQKYTANEVITAQFPSEGEVVRNVIQHKHAF